MENKDKNLVITKEYAGLRLDVFLTKINPELTRSHFKGEIENGMF